MELYLNLVKSISVNSPGSYPFALAVCWIEKYIAELSAPFLVNENKKFFLVITKGKNFKQQIDIKYGIIRIPSLPVFSEIMVIRRIFLNPIWVMII